MRKLTKKALSLMLCLLLVVSAFSGALSISAETVVNDAPLNLDFSDGLNHWTNTDHVAIKGNGAISFTEGRDTWYNLTTEKFAIPNLEVGDTVTFSKVITFDSTIGGSDSGATLATCFNTYLPDGTATENDYVYYRVADGVLNEFGVPCSGSATKTEIAVTDPNQTFKIGMTFLGGTAEAYTISDIKIIVTKTNGASYIYTNGANPNEVFLNLDFSDGFACWNNTDHVAIKGNGAISFTEGRDAWYNLITDEIKLPNLEAGDTVTFSKVITFDSTIGGSDSGATLATCFNTYLPDGTATENDYVYYRVADGVLNEYGVPCSGSATKTEIAVTDPKQTFKIGMTFLGGTAEAYTISDIKIIVTKTNGASYIYTNSTTPNEVFLNLDFSDGFACWNNTGHVAIKGNGAISFTEGRDYWTYLQTEEFTIPNLAVGDTVAFSRVITFDSAIGASDSGECVRTYFDTYLSDGTANENNCDYYRVADGVFNLYGMPCSGSAIKTEIAVTDPNQSFRIRIAKANGTAGAYIFSDIKIIVTKTDGTIWHYTNSLTPVEAYADGNVVGGTEADGYFSNKAEAVFKYPALSAPTNLDFEQGLKYWGTYMGNGDAGVAASTYASVQDGVLTLKRLTNTGWHDGISSQKFALPKVETGDTIHFYFEYEWDDENGKKRDFAFEVGTFTTEESKALGASWTRNLSQWFTSTNSNYLDKAPGELSDTGWRRSTIEHVVVNSDDLYNINFYQYANASIDEVDCAIKIRNLHVFKLLEDGTYLDLISDENYTTNIRPFGGTEEEGITIDPNGDYLFGFLEGCLRNHKAYGYTTGLLNGDFSKGLKHWGSSAEGAAIKSDPSAANLAALASVKDGVLTFNDYASAEGIISQGFKIPNLKEGDKIFLAFDTNYGSRFQFYLHEYPDQVNALYNAYAGGWDTCWDTSEWGTLTTAALTVVNPDDLFYITIKRAATTDTTSIKNVRILKADKGELKQVVINSEGVTELQDAAVKINADGSLQEGQLLGDANNDGKINLTDLVRMKKQAAGGNDLGIFLAAVDFDADDVITATDLSKVIAKIIDPLYDFAE